MSNNCSIAIFPYSYILGLDGIGLLDRIVIDFKDESILQEVVWFTFSKPMLNLHLKIRSPDYSPYMYYHNGLKE